MALTTQLVAHGRPAAVALADQLTARRGNDPLAPATVVVPRSWVGLSLRRLLAMGTLGNGNGNERAPAPGLANVSFLTLPRVAADLAVPALARRPGAVALHEVELLAAVRAALRAKPGVLAAVADQPATEAAVADAWRDLHGVADESLARLARLGPRQRDLVALMHAVSGLLGPRYDATDTVRAAVEVLASTPGSVTLPFEGPLLVHLPPRLTAPQEALVVALGAHADVHVLLGLTGDPSLDEPTAELATRLAGDTTHVMAQPVPPPLATHVRVAPTADVEVLVTLRDVLTRVEAGTRLDRIGLAYVSASPYAGLLVDACTQAGLPVVAPPTRRLAQTATGRALLDALAVLDDDWSSASLQHLAAATPAVRHGTSITPGLIAHVNREVRAIGGREAWRKGLRSRIARLDAKLADHEHESPGEAPDAVEQAQLRARREECAALASYLDGLADHLSPPPQPASWRDFARWARALGRFLLGAPDAHEDWPSDERQAFTTWEAHLDRLQSLDAIEPHPELPQFRRALDGLLDEPAPHTARFGEGLLIGPLHTMVGLDLDVIYVLGATDRALESSPRDDALLPDRDRRRAGGDVPLLAAEAGDRHRMWLHALAAAPTRIVSYPQVDARGGSELRPGRWLLDALTHLCHDQTDGRMLFSRDVDDLAPNDSFERVPSQYAAVASRAIAMSRDDLLLGVLTRAAAATPSDPAQALASHWLSTASPQLSNGWEMRLARLRGTYNRFEGRVRVPGRTAPGTERPMSATRLERYAACPRRYLIEFELGIRVEEEPTADLEPDARTIGNMVHKVLEGFLRAQCDLRQDQHQQPGRPWNPDDHARLDQIADRVFAEASEQGLTGDPLLWQARAAAIRRDLHAFLRADDKMRAEHGATPHSVEAAFGDTPDNTLAVPTASGGEARFHGRVDRVDLTANGGAIVVDYKTGKADAYTALRGDPVVRGQRLQPVLYGLATHLATGVPTDAISSGYWFVNADASFTRESITLDEQTLARFDTVVAELLAGIERGDFPARPIEPVKWRAKDEKFVPARESMCKYCDVEPACSELRERTWAGVSLAPELSTLVQTLDTPPGLSGDIDEGDLDDTDDGGLA